MRQRESRHARLGRRGRQPVVRRPVPVRVAHLGRLLADELLLLRGIAGGLRVDAQVLDHVLGRLHDDAAALVEALSACAPADLAEVAHAEDAGLLTVELAELREQDRSNGDVHADAERVGARDHLEQALLREPLDEQSILGQEPRVVEADSVPHEARDLLAIGRVEAEAEELGVDRLLLLARRHVVAHEVLRLFGGGPLGEIDHVDRDASPSRPNRGWSRGAASRGIRSRAARAAPRS